MNVNTEDPAANAIIGTNPDRMSRVILYVDGQLFVLRQWTANALDHSQFETEWEPLHTTVKRWTIPLRYLVQMRVIYWRHKLFGKHHYPDGLDQLAALRDQHRVRQCTCPSWGNPNWPHRHDCPIVVLDA